MPYTYANVPREVGSFVSSPEASDPLYVCSRICAEGSGLRALGYVGVCVCVCVCVCCLQMRIVWFVCGVCVCVCCVCVCGCVCGGWVGGCGCVWWTEHS